MLFLFGPTLPPALHDFFAARTDSSGHQILTASMGAFPSTESFAHILDDPKDIKGKPAIVFQSIAASGAQQADTHFMQLLEAGHTLKSAGAGPLWAVIPFGPYTRQDKRQDNKLQSLGCAVAGEVLKNYYTGLTSIEMHSQEGFQTLKGIFGDDQAYSLDPTEIFLDDLENVHLQNAVVVSPDQGANKRADALATALSAERFHIDKARSQIVDTKITGSHGDVEDRDAIVVDDMADTFGTAKNAIELVRAKGAKRVFFYAAHPILSDPARNRLVKLFNDGAIDRLRFCNTIERSRELAGYILNDKSRLSDHAVSLDISPLIYEHAINTIGPHPKMAGSS